MIVRIEIKIRHEVCLYIVNCFSEGFQEFIKIFLVKKDLMPVIPIFVEFLTAFGNSKIVIIAAGCPNIEEISSAFASPDTLTVHALHSFVIVLVRHYSIFLYE